MQTWSLFVAGYIHSDEGEFLADRSDIAEMGGDRESMRLKQRDVDLIKRIKGLNQNTVVCIIGSSPILIDEWEKDVPAILFTFYSGMEGGNVLADILFGTICPSGKLPYSVAYSEEDYPFFDPDCEETTYEYYHGYCKLEKEKKPVLYPFGFGLSYTSFEIVAKNSIINENTAKFKVTVKNTGACKGAEVVQLYIGTKDSCVDRPEKVLKDFGRVSLLPGESKDLSLLVNKSDMAYFDEDTDAFRDENITYLAYIGNSSVSTLSPISFSFDK